MPCDLIDQWREQLTGRAYPSGQSGTATLAPFPSLKPKTRKLETAPPAMEGERSVLRGTGYVLQALRILPTRGESPDDQPARSLRDAGQAGSAHAGGRRGVAPHKWAHEDVPSQGSPSGNQ